MPRHPELAVLLLRLFMGGVLVYGTQDNIREYDRLLEFRDFLARHGFPLPLASAWLSVWAQFLCGVLLLAGAATRVAAAVMVVNFVIALAMVHVGLPFDANIAPLAMLAVATFLALAGPGAYSVDARLATRRAVQREQPVHDRR